jgi:hypothetical protein
MALIAVALRVGMWEDHPGNNEKPHTTKLSANPKTDPTTCSRVTERCAAMAKVRGEERH